MNLRAADESLQLAVRRKLRVRSDFGLAIPKIEDGPWPNFPSDLMSVAIVVGTQSQGTVLFFEKMFESRMVFVDRLIDMGARIVPCDPHRVVVIGPARLHALHSASPDIRAGMAMLIAALCAKGESVIENAQVIDRGYEQVEQRLRRLGADIVREE
jgi:UDP-N-acetylglucosamine 1-carboxyvinyltransferase